MGSFYITKTTLTVENPPNTPLIVPKMSNATAKPEKQTGETHVVEKKPHARALQIGGQ